MGQVLHRRATTTEAVRRAIQHSQESLRALARRHGINAKTVAKWKKRESVSDLRTGPKQPRSTVLTVEQEAVFVAIDRTSKFVFTQLVAKADVRAAAMFLQSLMEAVPYRIHTVLTDNGIQFADLPHNRNGITARWRGHLFDRVCLAHGIQHRLTKPNHPWTNGQVERMNRTIKEDTVHRYHYDSHDQLQTHLQNFLNAYNFARRLKTLKGLTPYEFLCKSWQIEPDRFTRKPIHQMTRLYN